MGIGTVRLLNKILRLKGLKIHDINTYEEKLENVKYKWLYELNIQTILDIGASTGGYAKKARKVFPDAIIHSFEPIPQSFSRLQSYFKNDPNHHAYNIALSDANGIIKFNLNQSSGSSSILPITEKHISAYPSTANTNEISVQSDLLDNIFPTLNIKKNILMKLDVQGAESKVFAGGENTLLKCKVLYIETSFVELYDSQWLFNDLYQYLLSRGFYLAGIENVSQSLKDGSFLQADAYFVNKHV